ncbi:Predicted membrane protein, putative toxin regulator [Mycobacteroides abscessus subsp. abscessus]|nr:Predicted membrane protein, putative toxin regulator [Mycobacteroides abscessus subsp. abscessus]
MKKYLVDRMYKASSGIANAIFVTIGIGLLLETIGNMTGLSVLVTIGVATKMLMAPAIGAGIAIMLGGNNLTLFSAMAAGTVGADRYVCRKTDFWKNSIRYDGYSFSSCFGWWYQRVLFEFCDFAFIEYD